MAEWLTLTEPTGLPVVRPFAGMTARIGDRVTFTQPGEHKTISYKKNDT